MIDKLLADLQEKRKRETIHICDIKVGVNTFTVIIEMYHSRGERFKDFRHQYLETALQDAINYIDKNLIFK